MNRRQIMPQTTLEEIETFLGLIVAKAYNENLLIRLKGTVKISSLFI
jgi:hypothetical protein